MSVTRKRACAMSTCQQCGVMPRGSRRSSTSWTPSSTARQKAVAALLGGEAARVSGEELDRISELIAKARIAELAQKARKDGTR